MVCLDIALIHDIIEDIQLLVIMMKQSSSAFDALSGLQASINCIAENGSLRLLWIFSQILVSVDGFVEKVGINSVYLFI